MNRVAGLILALALGVLLAPATAQAQDAEPKNNMWTRSASLYIDRARNNPRPDEKQQLLQQALDAAVEGTQNDPSNPKVWYLAGVANLRLGQHAAADSMFDRAEALYSDYDEVELERSNAWINAYNAGVAQLQRGDVDAAIEQMQKADVIYQGRAAARLTLGSLYANKGDYDSAAAAYRGALEILRGPERQNLTPEQEAEWAENEEIAAFNLAQILASTGKDEEAVQAYQDYLARDPENVTAKTNLAVVLTRMERGDEAAAIYEELLARTDLAGDDYFNVGVGLFRAENYEKAAEAFRRAMELNPVSRDAVYNLAQAVYSLTLPLEDSLEAAAPARKKEIQAQLQPMFEELVQLTEKLREMDPYNQNVYALQARAYRGMGDVAPDAKTGDDWRRKALATLEAYEALPFQIMDVQIDRGDGTASVRGAIQNKTLAAGAPVTLKITLLGADGQAVGEQDVTITAPEPEAQAAFDAEITTTGDVAGWKYQVVG